MAEKEGGIYQRVADRVKKGDLTVLIDPLDYLILDKTLDEGTMMGDYYPLGTTVKSLVKQFKGLTSDQVSGRMNLLRQADLVKTIRVTGGNAYQRTRLGKEILEKWKATKK